MPCTPTRVNRDAKTIDNSARKVTLFRVGTMDSFQVANTLEVEEKIDEIVESLSLRRYGDYDPVIGISRITGKLSQLSYFIQAVTGGEAHITSQSHNDMEHVDSIEEEEGVVFYLMLLQRQPRRDIKERAKQTRPNQNKILDLRTPPCHLMKMQSS